MALDQTFTYWMTLPPRTAFRGIAELPAGHWMTVGADGAARTERYWDPDFVPDERPRPEEEWAEELRALLLDATRLQLRADVPVGAYLSGGLDSSVTTTLVKRFTETPVRTFSVTFEDAVYDESAYQDEMIAHLGTEHSAIRCRAADIGAVFPEVIWHAEKPVLRTAPAPLLLLSRLVRRSGYKVVLTGEGADEILAGYDIFKEAKIRRFIAAQPGSQRRRLILKRLYPYLAHSPTRSLSYAGAFFDADAGAYPATCYSHVPRWATTAKAKAFFSDGLRAALRGHEGFADLEALLDPRDAGFDPLAQAQYLEIKTLLSGYLLSSQGDRVAMASSVEARYPFLDHRVMEFCFRTPPRLRLRVLQEKYLLKKAMRPLLPPAITRRPKQPYMAPDAGSFLRGERLAYVEDLLSEERVRRAGWFNPAAVTLLVKKCRQSPVLGFKDNMALVGVLSTMLVQEQFVDNFGARAAAVPPPSRRRRAPMHRPEIRRFISENFLFGQEREFADGDSFLENGIIDSTGVLELVAFLDEKYGIAVSDEELLPQNLDSVANLAAFIARKQAEAAPAAEVAHR